MTWMCPVVTLVVAKGCLSTCRDFLEGVRSDVGCAFVLFNASDEPVDPPEFDGNGLKQIKVSDATILQPGSIYTVNRGARMSLLGCTLRVEQEAMDDPADQVDLFLRSVRRQRGESAIAVRFAAESLETATDSEGLQELEAAGGLVLHVSPGSSKSSTDGSSLHCDVAQLTSLINEAHGSAALPRMAASPAAAMVKRADAERSVRPEQEVIRERSIARLARAALSGEDIPALASRAVEAVSQALEVDLAAVLEAEPDGETLRVAERVGWRRTGQPRVWMGAGSYGRYVMSCREPVVIADVAADTRFDEVGPLSEQGAVSGIAAVVGGRAGGFGMIEAFARRRREFATEDVQFLQAVAEILTDAVLQHRQIEHLERSVALYRTIGESIPFGIWVADAEGNLLEISQAFADLVGRSRQACLNSGWLDVVLEGDRDRVARTWREAIAGKREWRCEYGLARAGGGNRYLLSRGAAVYGQAGEVVGWAGVHLDITERRLAERQVQRLNQKLEQEAAEQTARVWLMQDLAVAANEATSLRQVLRYALRRIGEHVGCAVGRVYLVDKRSGKLRPTRIALVRDEERFGWFLKETTKHRFAQGEGLVGRVLRTGQPEWAEDVGEQAGWDLDPRPVAQAGLHTALAMGVQAGGEAVAVLEFFFDERREPDRRLQEILANIGAQLGRVAERRRWERELAEAIWQQQKRFGQEIHDGLGQDITGLSYLARSLQQGLSDRELPEAETGEVLAEGLQNILGQVRRLAKGLFPVEVDSRGLMAALEELVEQTQRRCGLPCRFVCDQPVRVDDNHVATHLFRIAQEAINNAVKHARASELEIVLSASGPGQVSVSVRDDGVGLENPDRHQNGIGLRIMRHRADLIRATLDVRSQPSGGTWVTCSLRKDDRDDSEQ